MERNRTHDFRSTEETGRLYWVCSAARWKDLRAHEWWSDRGPLHVANTLEAASEIELRTADTVVMDCEGGGEESAGILAAIRRMEPEARLMLRSSTPLEDPAGRGFEYLDPAEGPEVLRARIGIPIGPRGDPRGEVWGGLILGQSVAMRRVVEMIRLVGDRRCTVLITGETGTGKEVVARSIHLAGKRAKGPFVAVNCSALPPALLEAELFGHTRGAFTGANQLRVGRFELAHGGTLLLDEIGDMPLDLQAKLLRVLQEREFQRLGSSETVRMDVRVVAATNCNLREKVRQGTFREDLYYRLNVVPIELPPLRARGGDAIYLVWHFLAKTCADEGLPLKRIDSNALQALREYSWPGNVRQLENAVAAAVILAGEREVLLDRDFHFRSEQGVNADHGFPAVDVPEYGMDFEKVVSDFERSILLQALRRTNGNKKLAAEMLGLKRTTLAAKVRVLEITEGCRLS